MLIVNLANEKRRLSTFFEASDCERCHNHVQHIVVHTWKRLSIYFVIPVMTYAHRWFVECPTCSHRRAISREKANDFTATLPQTLDQAA